MINLKPYHPKKAKILRGKERIGMSGALVHFLGEKETQLK